MKIEVVGWYGNKKNVGDESFRAAHCLAFRNHNLSFVTPPRSLNNPDMVVLGGGAVVAPFYMDVLKDAQCPKYALGVSISWASEMELFAKYNFKGVYLRDEADVEACRAKAGCPVEYTPDLAFLHRPSGGNILVQYQKYPDKKPLGVMVTDYVNPAINRDINIFSQRANEFKVKMANELDVLSEQGWEVFLIPCSTGGYGDDRRINLDLTAFMKHRPTLIMDTLSPQDCIDLIAQMQLTVCQKFHAHIFSMIAGTPFVSIAFTRKVAMLLEGHGLKQTTCAEFPTKETFDTSRFNTVVNEVLASSESYRKLYLETSYKHYKQIHKVIGTIQQDWLGESP